MRTCRKRAVMAADRRLHDIDDLEGRSVAQQLVQGVD